MTLVLEALKVFWAFFRVGLFSFGGGYAMVPLIQREVVSINHWLTAGQFVDLIAISEMTPGPISINSATFVGYRAAGALGSTMATFGVILPSFLVTTGLTYAFVKYSNSEIVRRILGGIRPVIVSLVVTAAVLVLPTSIIDWRTATIAIVSFVALVRTKINPLVVLAFSGLAGAIFFR
jgi:chromate transporter